MVGNYVSKQPIERISYSQKWVCRGFSKKWKTFLEVYGSKAVEVWDKWLLGDFYKYREAKLVSWIEANQYFLEKTQILV